MAIRSQSQGCLTDEKFKRLAFLFWFPDEWKYDVINAVSSCFPKEMTRVEKLELREGDKVLLRRDDGKNRTGEFLAQGVCYI